MATDTAPAPNPGRNRDLGSLEQRLLEFARKAKDQASKTNVTETVARDTYKNWLSENLEVVLGEYDLAYLLNQKGFLAMFARLLKSLADMNEQARLLLFNAWAAYVDQSNIGGPLVADTLAGFFYALPKALPLMFNDPSPKLEHINAELEKLARTTGYSDLDSMKLWKLKDETEVIHKDGAEWHPMPADSKVLINQGTPYSMFERFPEGPWCPICFRRELRAGTIRIEKVEKTAAPKRGRGFVHLSDFDPSKREFIEMLLMLCRSEVKTDPGLGLAGDAGHVIAAVNLALDTKESATALERITPDDPKAVKRMYALSNMTRVQVEEEKLHTGKQFLLPKKVRLFVERVIAGYSVANPVSHSTVVVKDRMDRMWDWAPPGIKPKKKGWAGVQEAAGSWPGLIFLALVAIVIMLAMFTAALVFSSLAYIVGVILSGLFEVPELFRPHMSNGMMTVQKGVAAAWLLLVLLPIVGHVNARFESYRPRLQTLRIVVAGVGLGTALIGWGTGWFNSTPVAIFVVALWSILLSVEAANKYTLRLSAKFTQEGTERLITAFAAIGVVALLFSVFYFAALDEQDAKRVTVLANGVTNRGIDKIADATGVEVPPSAERCAKGLEQLTRDAQKLEMSIDRICDLTNNDFPCTCR